MYCILHIRMHYLSKKKKKEKKKRLLNKLNVLPPGVSRNGLEEPLVGDCGAVRVAGQHDRKLEERGRSPVKYLNVYGIDFLQLLRQDGVVIGVQNLREGKDKVAVKTRLVFGTSHYKCCSTCSALVQT